MTMCRILGAAVVVAAGGRAMAQITLNTLASDDVWVYGHSLNPAFDPLLRVWSDGVDPIHPCPPDDYHSYSYVKFHLTPTFDPSKTYRVLGSTLTLTQQFDPGYTQDQATAAPLLAYSLGDSWDEKTWDFTKLGLTEPAPAEPYFGSGDTLNYVASGARFPIPIDLLGRGAQRFTDYFNTSLKAGGDLDFALCSLLAPGGPTGIDFYKLISKDHASGLGPALHVVAEPVKAVSGTVDLDGIAIAPTGVPVAFEVRQVGTTNVLESFSIPLDAAGKYTLFTAQTASVDVAAKGAVWLRGVQTVDLTGATDAVNFSLTGGDADGNNAVNLKDLGVVLLNFNTAGPAGDLNLDGKVGLSDLGLVLLNYNQTGAP